MCTIRLKILLDVIIFGIILKLYVVLCCTTHCFMYDVSIINSLKMLWLWIFLPWIFMDSLGKLIVFLNWYNPVLLLKVLNEISFFEIASTLFSLMSKVSWEQLLNVKVINE